MTENLILAKLAILLSLCGSSGSDAARGVIRNLQLSKAVIPHTLNTLSALGYLRRKRGESDFRTISITPTPNEARFLERLEKFIGQDRPARSRFGLYGDDAA